MRDADDSRTPVRDERSRLRTLLHDVRQYAAAGLLLYDDEADALEPEELQRRLTMGKRLFHQLSALVDHEVHDASSPRQMVQLRDLVDECLANFRHAHPSVTLESDLRGPLVCLLDRQGLHRALTNVLENAARAAGVSGRVDVRGRQRDGQVIIDVTDDGEGFGQISRGTGHGMQTVDEVVRAAHGRLEIRSGPDSGTRVRLRFPCLQSTKEAS